MFLVTPNTGLKTNLKNYYGLRFKPTRVRLKYFKKFPQGLNYYLFSLFSIIKAFSLKPDIFITRNLFTLFILVILKKKVIIELHHDLSNEGKLISFLYNNFSILNSKYIIKIIAITKSVKNFLINDLKVFRKKIQIIPSASDLKVKFSLLKKKKKIQDRVFWKFRKKQRFQVYNRNIKNGSK